MNTENKEEDYYKILGCNKTDSEKEISKKFRNLSKEWHPDKAKN